MKPYVLFLLSVLSLLPASCGTFYYHNPATNVRVYAGNLGGKHKIASLTIEGEFDMQGYDADMEKSFEDANRTLNTLGTGYILASAQKAIEAGKRAVESDGIKAATQQAKIDSDTTLGLAAEETKRLMIEPPPAAPVPAP